MLNFASILRIVFKRHNVCAVFKKKKKSIISKEQNKLAQERHSRQTKLDWSFFYISLPIHLF